MLSVELAEAMKEHGAFTRYRRNVWGGHGCEVKPDVFFDYEGFVVMGQGVVIADHARIRTHAHPAMLRREDWRPYPTEPHVLVIESDVFIGDSALITPSCKHIATGTIINMGSVVTKSITEPYGIWGGNPARRIGERK